VAVPRRSCQSGSLGRQRRSLDALGRWFARCGCYSNRTPVRSDWVSYWQHYLLAKYCLPNHEYQLRHSRCRLHQHRNIRLAAWRLRGHLEPHPSLRAGRDCQAVHAMRRRIEARFRKRQTSRQPVQRHCLRRHWRLIQAARGGPAHDFALIGAPQIPFTGREITAAAQAVTNFAIDYAPLLEVTPERAAP